MAIARPEAIDDALALASRSAAEDGGSRLFCFAMQSTRRVRRKIAGGRRCGKGDRGAAVLRPDQAIRGHVERTRPGQPWGDTWRHIACTNKAEAHDLGQRLAIAHGLRCRLNGMTAPARLRATVLPNRHASTRGQRHARPTVKAVVSFASSKATEAVETMRCPPPAANSLPRPRRHPPVIFRSVIFDAGERNPATDGQAADAWTQHPP